VISAPMTAYAVAPVSTPTTSATIIVSLPAEAKLTIDGNPTTSTSNRRVFVSPELPTGRTFNYTLKAEVSVAGRTEVITKVVSVQAGSETQAQLELPANVASAK
jgi:uncharacterized protein (TIGR03000 family)